MRKGVCYRRASPRGIRLRRSSLLTLIASVAAVTQLAAAPLTPEQTLGRRALSSLTASPDGQRVAFVVTGPPGEKGRAENLWLFDLASGTARALTHSPNWCSIRVRGTDSASARTCSIACTASSTGSSSIWASGNHKSRRYIRDTAARVRIGTPVVLCVISGAANETE